ncbi:Uncharacterised protein [Weissella viridescens]|uniref:Uncharacterized protein n=1 Tax=Weissella viridescens TaxID=1629 RepID=A0A380P208_WEIVI|nr:Uncharacterised protein [Weissella viridescens]
MIAQKQADLMRLNWLAERQPWQQAVTQNEQLLERIYQQLTQTKQQLAKLEQQQVKIDAMVAEQAARADDIEKNSLVYVKSKRICFRLHSKT